LNEKVCAATNIVINRVECRKTVKVETIAYATKYQEDEDLILGYNEVLVEGKNGEKEVTSLKRYIDGKLVASKILEENVVEPAVDKVVLKGTGVENAGVPASTISQVSQLQCPKDLIIDKNGAPIKYSKVYTGKSCAYSAKRVLIQPPEEKPVWDMLLLTLRLSRTEQSFISFQLTASMFTAMQWLLTREQLCLTAEFLLTFLWFI
jgi:hypothetical protein